MSQALSNALAELAWMGKINHRKEGGGAAVVEATCRNIGNSIAPIPRPLVHVGPFAVTQPRRACIQVVEDYYKSLVAGRIPAPGWFSLLLSLL